MRFPLALNLPVVSERSSDGTHELCISCRREFCTRLSCTSRLNLKPDGYPEASGHIMLLKSTVPFLVDLICGNGRVNYRP